MDTQLPNSMVALLDRSGFMLYYRYTLRLMAEYNDAWFVLIGGWIQVRASVTSMDMTMTPVTGSIA
jgi:hypothetical protein